ncbi:unnamed protein product [marine sediment metagenome]|uniref:Uncharacterized protein n=1 Tax=marine sediment metagenome TaxID=412755 RepID=X0RPG8_9ZZZZ
MRRAILSFELPEDVSEYNMCNMAGDMYGVLTDIDNLLRGRLKHADMSADTTELAELIRDMILQLPMETVQ